MIHHGSFLMLSLLALISLRSAFQQYIKDNHGTGLTWNKEKPAATATTKAGSSGAPAPPPPPPGGAPPPPPPPPAGAPPPPPPGGKPAVAAKPDTSELFAAINKG